MAADTQTSPVPRGVHLWLRLWKAAKSVETLARRSIDSTGLCLSDFGILEALLHQGPLPVNVLGRKVLLTSGSVTTAVQRLERAGLVRRSPSPSDRRTRLVHLTPESTEIIRKAFEAHSRDMEQAFSVLSPEERKSLANLLRRLVCEPQASPEAGVSKRHEGQSRG